MTKRIQRSGQHLWSYLHCGANHIKPIPEVPLSPVDFERLHLEVASHHARLGSPIYAQSVGDTKIVWVADAGICEDIFRHEGSHPVPVRPESWLEFNRVNQVILKLI